MTNTSIGSTFIVNVIIKLITIILFGLTYVYIVNLENKGCKCAQTHDSNFIKSFSLFGMIFLIIVMFIPHKLIYKTMGPTLSILINSIEIFFLLVSVYWFYVTYRYTRYLVNEKCKCSDDMRREIIMIGSLIEFIIIFFVFILGLLLSVIAVSIATTINYVINNQDDIYSTISNPIKSASKIPSKLNSNLKTLKGIYSNTKTGVKKLTSNKK